ncbi:MAG: hypothetical protein Q9161_007030 [Pseudevernia consocians]
MGDSSNFNVAPRRLSKPRTIKSSSNLNGEQPTTPSSPHNSPDQDYFGRDAVVVNSHGERRSRSKSRSRIRAYLYGSSHDVIQYSSDDEEAPTGIAGAARDVKKRLSRTGSSITPLQSTKSSATRLSNSSSSGLLSVCSTEPPKMDPEESATIADQIKQRVYHDSLAAQNHVLMPVDEDRHVDSLMAPFRRKSLYTPGIATRNASDILRKPPKPSTDHDYYYDPSRPETSPLSQLAALTAGEDGRSTPCDLHYSQLGGLQLGTLRVTNGADSPVPGYYRSATPESKTHDEYYTASEGSVTGDADHATPLPPRSGSPLKYESELEASMQTYNQVPSSPDKSLLFERESSSESFPFSRETANQAARTRFRTETPSDILRSEEGILIELFPCQRASSRTGPLEATRSNNFSPPEKEKPHIPFSAENKLRDGMDNLEGKTSKESFPLEIGQSKAYRVEGRRLNESFPSQSETADELVLVEEETVSKPFPFQNMSPKACSVEGKTPEKCFFTGGISPNGTSDIANEYIAELDGSPFSYSSLENKRHIIPQPQPPAEEMQRSLINDAEVQHAGNVRGSKEDALRKLTVNANLPSTWRPDRLSVPGSRPSRCRASSEMDQTDSGYCSYASLTGTPANEIGFESGDNSISSTMVSASSPPQAVETVRSSARSSLRIPVRKLRKQRPKSQPPPVNFISVKQCHELADVHIPRVPSIIAARHADRLAQFPLLEHTFQSSQHTTADRTLSPTQPHHELIRFPSPANALEAASAPLRSHPTASSKQRASTSVVKEDEFGPLDLVRSPSWSEFGGGRRKKEQKKLAKETKHLEKRLQREKKEDDKRRSARSRSASRTRASRQYDPLVTIADFGTVTESLGNSPYDIATAMSNPSNTSPVASNWHPHQMSTAMARPKSMFGMDEAAATDFARARSRNRSQSFGRPSVGHAVRISTSGDSHDLQATGDAGTRDKAIGMPSALPSLSTADLTGSDPFSSTKPSTPATKTATPLGMPQWISDERHRDFCGGRRPQSLFIDAPSVPALAAVDFRPHNINWARDRQRSQSFSTAGAEEFDDRGGSPGKSVRLHSDDTPPVPALPSIQQVKQREAEIIKSRPHSMIVEAPLPTMASLESDQRKAIGHPPEPEASATPRKTKGSKIVPDIWSNGSLERKSPKTVERSRQVPNHSPRENEEALPVKDNLWETQSYAWSQRRKSAGEALLRNQVRDILDRQEAANPAPLYEDSNRPSSLATAITSGGCQSFTPTPSHLGPFPNPLALHHQLRVQQRTYTSNAPALHHQPSTQQTQLPGFNPLASHHRPSVFSIQPENQIPISAPRRAQTQLFQIPRKRIGSSPSVLRTENAIGSGRSERALV